MKNIGSLMRKHVDNVEKFIKHNLDNGNINENTTIKELLELISSINECYIPIVESMEKYVFENMD